MGRVVTSVATDPIELSWLEKAEFNDAHGAVNIFLGRVRAINLGRTVVGVEYDCHEILCKKVFDEIAIEAQAKWWPDANVAVVHRHGRLGIGDVSVLIACSTGHRDESYRITRYIIEEIKTRAPIWKKETYADGESEWVRGHALCQHGKVEDHETHRTHSCGREIHPHGSR